MLDRACDIGPDRILHFCRFYFHPPLDAVRVCEAGKIALSIEQHNQHGAPGYLGLHHQASSCLIDEARLGEADLPARAPDQAIAVAELQ